MNLNQLYKAIKEAKELITSIKASDEWMRNNMPEKMDAEAESISAHNLELHENYLAKIIAEYKEKGGKRNV